MEFSRIEKVNLVSCVYRQIHETIVSGKTPEGTKLASENELAKQFSVSRVVIREALQQLRSEKLIVTRQGLGTFVANPDNFATHAGKFDLSESTYRDFLNFRRAVEWTAIELSRNTATEADFDAVESCVRRMEENQDNALAYNEADYDFHLAMVKLAHNPFLETAMLANKTMILSVFSAMNGVPDARHFGVTSHQEMVDLLRKHDTKAILHRYDDMGKYNMTRLEQFFENRP